MSDPALTTDADAARDRGAAELLEKLQLLMRFDMLEQQGASLRRRWSVADDIVALRAEHEVMLQRMQLQAFRDFLRGVTVMVDAVRTCVHINQARKRSEADVASAPWGVATAASPPWGVATSAGLDPGDVDGLKFDVVHLGESLIRLSKATREADPTAAAQDPLPHATIDALLARMRLVAIGDQAAKPPGDSNSNGGATAV